MILVIDTYDSFVHNLARYLDQLSSHEVTVVRNDELDFSTDASAVVISPGPGAPDQAGRCIQFVRKNLQRVPILGVCLGHQIIVQALGGTIVQGDNPRHGKASLVFHDSHHLFDNIPSPFSAGRYHSLVAAAAGIPDCLSVTARTDEGLVMAVQHRTLPVFGLQFHPESVLTQHGYQILGNFLTIVGLNIDSSGQRKIFA